MAFCHSRTVFRLPAINVSHVPLSPTPGWPLQASLSSALKSSQWPHGFLWGGASWHHQGPSLAWSSVSRCPEQTSAPGVISLGSPYGPTNGSCAFPWCYLCLRFNVYFSFERKLKNSRGRCSQRALSNLAESTRSCPRLSWRSMLPGFFIVLMYLTVKLAGECGENNVKTPSAHPGGSLGLQERERKRLLQQRLYVQYLNPAQDGPCEICVQCAESETRHGNWQ